MKIIWFASSIALLIAVLPLPYGYYMLLRLLITASAAYVAYKNFNKEIPTWGVVFVAVAMLFNPVYLVHFDKALWAILDIAVAALFFINSKKH